MYAFLRRPKWIVSHVLIVASLIVTMVVLGFWQLDRLERASGAPTIEVENRLGQFPRRGAHRR